jgi:hypothetical protein
MSDMALNCIPVCYVGWPVKYASGESVVVDMFDFGSCL